MTPTSNGWQDILDEGEEIQWQGRPSSQLIWTDLISFESFFGLFFAGFSLFWITGASQATSGISSSRGGGGIDGVFAFFPLFGLPFLAVGLYMVAGRIFWDAFRRRGTWYTLTNRAAYIARDTMGKRSLKRYGIGDMKSPDLQDGNPGSVIFAEEISTYRTSSRNGPGRRRTQVKPVGFRQIDDPRTVYRMVVSLREAEDRDT